METKKLLTILAVVFLSALGIKAQTNTLSTPDVTMGSGKEIPLPINLDNLSDIVAVQFTISIPDGLTVRENGISTTDRSSAHDISFSKKSDGSYKVILLSSDNSIMRGRTGSIMTIPILSDENLKEGTVLLPSFSDVAIVTRDGSNVATGCSNGTVTIAPTPDLIVKDINTIVGEITPGENIVVNWTVENIGSVATEGGWSEQIALVSQDGSHSRPIATTYHEGILDAGGLVSRQTEIALPILFGIDGNTRVQVRVVPTDKTGEALSAQDNNTATGTSTIFVHKVLQVALSKNRIDENDDRRLSLNIGRSGFWQESETFEISTSEDARVKLPSSITIPANQSGSIVKFNVSNNDILDNDSIVTITVKGSGYPETTGILTIEDDEMPLLSITVSNDEINEGETLRMTITSNRKQSIPTVINLTCEKPGRFTFPRQVTMPADEDQVSFDVIAIDNDDIETDETIAFIASANRFERGECLVTLYDDDMPSLEFTLSPENVSEAAGYAALMGTIKRSDKLDKRVTIKISDDSNGLLSYSSKTIVLEKNQKQAQFSIGVNDNDIVDGDHKVTVTASVYSSSCGCSVGDETNGSLTANMTIIDDDGPSLSLSSSQSIIAEGNPNGIFVTVMRNADFDKALTVYLTCDSTAAVELPSSVIIPQNEKSTSFRITASDNYKTDDDRIVVVSAKAVGYSSSSMWMMISDRTLPDARIPKFTVSTKEAKVGEEVVVNFTLASTGVLPLPAQTCVAIYADDSVLDRIWLQEPLPQGTTKDFSRKITLPLRTGTSNLYAVANYDSMFKEINSSDNFSSRIPIIVTAPYSASVTLDRVISSKGQSVVVKGSIDSAFSKKDEVEIYIINDGLRSTVMTKALPDGSFETEFTPLPEQGGHFSVGACYPEEGLTKEMASFDIPDIKRTEKGFITCEAIAGTTSNVSIGIMNPCGIPMTGLKAKGVGVPEGCSIEFNTVNTLEAGRKASLELSLTGSQISEGKDWETFNIIVESAEGAVLNLPFYWYCRSSQASLVASISIIEAELPIGKTIECPVTVTNNGLGDSGILDIVIPAWMKCAGPTRIPALAPGESTLITLLLTPSDDMLINQLISGRLVINCENGKGLSIDYKVIPVSDQPAVLEVSVCDEFTYNTTEAPKVKGAKVKVVNPGNFKTVAEGFSDEDGMFTAELSAGYYQLEVSAERHDSWTGTVFLNPGKTNSVKANISFNPITISYNVVPTEIEDEYSIETTTRFETNLPLPIVRIIAPDRIDGDNMKVGESTLINIKMVNEGLMTAFKARPIFEEDNPEWSFELLDYKEPFDLAPHQTVNIPVKITRRAEAQNGNRVVAPNGPVGDMIRSFNGCMTIIVDEYEVICGEPIWKNSGATAMAMKMCATAATMAGIFSALQDLISDGPNMPGYDGWSGKVSESITEFGTSDKFTICDPCDAEKANNFINNAIGAVWPSVGDTMKAMDESIEEIRKKKNLEDGYGNSGDNNSGDHPNGEAQNDEDTFNKIRDNIVEAAISDASMAADNIAPGTGDIVGLGGLVYDLAKPCTTSEQNNITTSFDDSTPSFNHSWQEVFYNESRIFVKAWQAMLDIQTAFFGDPIWMLDKTQDKLEFMKVASTIKPGTQLTDEEVMAIKPESVSLELTRSYLDRELGFINIDREYGDVLNDRFDYLCTAQDNAREQGFGNSFERYYQAYLNYGNEFEKLKNNSICASIGLRFSQTMTMTREAFRGTLEVFNGHEDIPMRDVRLNLTVTDQSGIQATYHEFQINPETLNGFKGDLILGSGWTLDAGKTGTADILFIPTRYAAPEGPAKWSFGGSISYVDPFTDLEVTRNLQPVTLIVNPSPQLDLTYFLQRDVYADDPLTKDIVESSERAEFALVIRNSGEGDAKKVRLATQQPQIISNEKGIILETSFCSSQLNGETSNLPIGESIGTDFGDIPSNKSVYAQWWFESSLAGHFTKYEINSTHVTSYGNPDLSLLGNIEIRELIRGITDPTSEEGVSRRLFLTNEVPDSNDLPDMVYSSDGNSEFPLGEAELSVMMIDRQTCEVNLQPQSPGWVYGSIDDPTGGRMRIKSIIRLSDGVELPTDNCWQTSMTLRDGNSPLHEAKLHLAVNTTKPDIYRVEYEYKPIGILQVEAIKGISAYEYEDIDPVKELTICFSKEVNPESFTQNALHMTRDGQSVDLSCVKITKLTSTDYSVTFDNETRFKGFYTFHVNAERLNDMEGFAGENSKNVMWLQKGDNIDGVFRPSADCDNLCVSPVPVRETMTIKGVSSRIAELYVFDSSGKQLARWMDLYPDSSMGITVPVKDISSGFKIITAIMDDGSIFSRRILFIEQ